MYFSSHTRFISKLCLQNISAIWPLWALPLLTTQCQAVSVCHLEHCNSLGHPPCFGACHAYSLLSVSQPDWSSFNMGQILSPFLKPCTGISSYSKVQSCPTSGPCLVPALFPSHPPPARPFLATLVSFLVCPQRRCAGPFLCLKCFSFACLILPLHQLSDQRKPSSERLPLAALRTPSPPPCLSGSPCPILFFIIVLGITRICMFACLLVYCLYLFLAGKHHSSAEGWHSPVNPYVPRAEQGTGPQ